MQFTTLVKIFMVMFYISADSNHILYKIHTYDDCVK